MKERINFNDLYYGICSMDQNTKKMVSYNIFDIYRVKRSVADWVMMSDERKSGIEDPIRFCFGDTWSRVEYEWIVSPWPPKDGEEQKVDVYSMYVEPNRALLMDMLDNVSLKSAREWRTADNRRLKGEA